MAKVIDSVELNLQMWSTVVLSAEEIQDIYPEFADMTDFEDTDDLDWMNAQFTLSTKTMEVSNVNHGRI